MVLAVRSFRVTAPPMTPSALVRLPLIAAALLVLAGCAPTDAPAQTPPQGGAEAGEELAPEEEARVLDNLRVEIPELAALDLDLGPLGPSGADGVRLGTLTVDGRQTVPVLLSDDGARLFLLAGEPLDVGRDEDALGAVRAERAAAEAQADSLRRSVLAPLVAGRPALGDADAPVTVVEFTDLQCPYCARGAATVEEVLEQRTGDVRVVSLPFPLGFHDWARPAAIASECLADDPDVYWAVRDALYRDQSEVTTANVLDRIGAVAAAGGADPGWRACATDESSAAYRAAASTVDRSVAAAEQLGVTGTPAYFVNGRLLSGARPLADFLRMVDAARGDA